MITIADIENIITNDSTIQKLQQEQQQEGTLHLSQQQHTFQLEKQREGSLGALPVSPAPLPYQSPNFLIHQQETVAPSDITPPDTTIISAIDTNNGLNVQNQDTISALSPITFIFESSDDIGVSGYVCSVDGSPTYHCASPFVFIDDYHNLQAPMSVDVPQGDITSTDMSDTVTAAPASITTGHILQVSAIDIAGNIDPNPAVFTWNVKQDTTHIPGHPETIDALPLPPVMQPPNTIPPGPLTSSPPTLLPEIPRVQSAPLQQEGSLLTGVPPATQTPQTVLPPSPSNMLPP